MTMTIMIEIMMLTIVRREVRGGRVYENGISRDIQKTINVNELEKKSLTEGKNHEHDKTQNV